MVEIGFGRRSARRMVAELSASMLVGGALMLDRRVALVRALPHVCSGAVDANVCRG